MPYFTPPSFTTNEIVTTTKLNQMKALIEYLHGDEEEITYASGAAITATDIISTASSLRVEGTASGSNTAAWAFHRAHWSALDDSGGTVPFMTLSQYSNSAVPRAMRWHSGGQRSNQFAAGVFNYRAIPSGGTVIIIPSLAGSAIVGMCVVYQATGGTVTASVFSLKPNQSDTLFSSGATTTRLFYESSSVFITSTGTTSDVAIWFAHL